MFTSKIIYFIYIENSNIGHVWTSPFYRHCIGNKGLSFKIQNTIMRTSFVLSIPVRGGGDFIVQKLYRFIHQCNPITMD